MMMKLSCDVLAALNGRTLATAESCTGGGIGTALTAIPGSSAVFKGGIICYTNEVKAALLGVNERTLERFGAVSAQIAEEMASGARLRLNTDIAISVTGLAGPGGDDFGNPVGTVYVGYSDVSETISEKHHFHGNREEIRQQAIVSALQLILNMTTGEDKHESF